MKNTLYVILMNDPDNTEINLFPGTDEGKAEAIQVFEEAKENRDDEEWLTLAEIKIGEAFGTAREFYGGNVLDEANPYSE